MKIDHLPDLVRSRDIAWLLSGNPDPSPADCAQAFRLLRQVGARPHPGSPCLWSLRDHDRYRAMRPWARSKAWKSGQ